jgi:hypothetical protein
MAYDYQYENLGPEKFQQLCQSLLSKDHPRIQCFPLAADYDESDG